MRGASSKRKIRIFAPVVGDHGSHEGRQEPVSTTPSEERRLFNMVDDNIVTSSKRTIQGQLFFTDMQKLPS
jgi:hypothetical protein